MQIVDEKRYEEKETAKRLGISQITLKRKRTAGLIGFYKIGSRIVYGEHHIEEFLINCEQNGRTRIQSTENSVA